MPSVIFRMFALWTNASFFLLFIESSRANFAILSEAARVIIFIATPTPWATSNSFPEYNPSVFSLTTIKSIPGFRAVTFGRVREGRTLAYRLKRERIVTPERRGDDALSLQSIRQRSRLEGSAKGERWRID